MHTVARARVLVVSLPAALDRRERFVARASENILPFEFFDACNGLIPTLNYEPSVALKEHGRALQAGELGCYSSHYAIWQQLLSDKEYDQYIVLEDDIIADWRRLKQIAEFPFAADGLHYVRLYQKSPARFIVLKKQFITRDLKLIRLLDSAYGTQGYVITREGARAFLKSCREVRRPIDDEMDRWWAHGVPNMALFPSPLIEEAGSSGIGAARFDACGARTTPASHQAFRRRERAARRIATYGLLLRDLAARLARNR